MYKPVPLIALTLILAAGLTTAANRSQPAASEDGIDVYFSPGGGAAAAVVHEITQARKSVTVGAYWFTNADIAKALLDAHKRKVDVRVLLDKSQRGDRYSSSTFMVNNGIPTWITEQYAIYHMKVVLIDGRTIVTGSMNFTKAGDTKNAENTLIIRDKPTLYAAYAQQLEADIKKAERLTATGD